MLTYRNGESVLMCDGCYRLSTEGIIDIREVEHVGVLAASGVLPGVPFHLCVTTHAAPGEQKAKSFRGKCRHRAIKRQARTPEDRVGRDANA